MNLRISSSLQISLLLFLFLPGRSVVAQPVSPEKSNRPKQIISLGPVIPVGEFSNTHSFGVGIDYSLRFGRLFLTHKKQLGFIANAGFAFYPGKKENTGLPASYKYPPYPFFHFFGGINYAPLEKITLNVLAGPGIGLYNDNTHFNIGAIICCNYYISGKIAITPGLIIMKETGSDPLYSAALKAAIVF